MVRLFNWLLEYDSFTPWGIVGDIAVVLNILLIITAVALYLIQTNTK